MAGFTPPATSLLAMSVKGNRIHGLTWGLCNPQRFKVVEFGFAKEYLTPYSTCT